VGHINHANVDFQSPTKTIMTTFRNLNVYTKSKELVKQIYELLKKFPREEQFALSDQLRRAVISIPSNIAEGSGHNSQKDQAHFYNIAYGSLMEVFSQLDIACDLGYISQEEFNQLESLINEEAKMLSGLIAKRKQPIAQRPLN
jgi:four helix bundle protein